MVPINPELSHYMKEIGAKGGHRTSKAKRLSSRENGKLGGRPKKGRDRKEKKSLLSTMTSQQAPRPADPQPIQ